MTLYVGKPFGHLTTCSCSPNHSSTKNLDSVSGSLEVISLGPKEY